MRTYKLFASISATGAAAASVTMLKNGRVKSIRWACKFDGPADNATIDVAIENQGSSTSNINLNDTPSMLDQLSILNNILTSGGNANAYKYQTFLDFPVALGEKLFINAVVTGTVACNVTVFLDIDEAR